MEEGLCREGQSVVICQLIRDNTSAITAHVIMSISKQSLTTMPKLNNSTSTCICAGPISKPIQHNYFVKISRLNNFNLTPVLHPFLPRCFNHVLRIFGAMREQT